MRDGNRPTVVVLVAPDAATPPALEPVEREADLRVVHDADSLQRAIVDADVVAVYDFRSTLLPDAIPLARRLRWIHAASAGVDVVMVPPVTERSDIVVTNSRGIFDEAIAEYVLGAILMFAKDSKRSIRLQQERRWQHRESERLAGRQVLVVGTGSIGRAIARLTSAAGLHVRGVARSERPEDPDFGRIAPITELQAELRDQDFVVLAVPLTRDTHHMIGADELAAMPRGARLINVARGPVVDERALIDALRSGHLGGAALDVFEEEPLPEGSPLWEMEHVLITPHQAGDFVGWVAALSQLFAENFGRWQRGEQLLNVVDGEQA